LACAPAAGANYDTFDDETLNDLNAFGEVPYVSGAPRQFTTPQLDTTSFTIQSGENASGANNVNGCLKPSGAVFAGKTAWVRFNPGVAGEIRAIAQTPGYDSIIMLREGREAAFRTATFSDVRGRDNNCSDINNAAGDEETVITAKAENVYYVQVGGKCPTPNNPATCSDPGVQGGATTIRLTFTPADGDQDGVPDTQERAGCNGEGRPGFVTPDGCADEDRDSVADRDESPGCAGVPGVPADAPYNGCPDGPAPPRVPGEPSVVIEAADGNPDNTRSIDVVLNLNWRKGTRSAVATNSANDPEVPIPLQARVPWKLRPGTKSESREVQVRFRGPGISEGDSDTITLDPNPPTIGKTLLTKSGGGRFFVGLAARDDSKGSGIAAVNVLDSRRRRVAGTTVCTKKDCAERLAGRKDVVRRVRGKPSFVQVIDAVGNSSTKKLTVTAARCRILVPTGGWGTKCYKLKGKCRRKDPPYWGDANPRLKCVRGRIRKR